MAREFWVGEWLVEPDLNRITRSERTVSIEPKVIEVLVTLASQPGTVIAKKEILRSVWHDVYVSEDALLYAISELRRAFGDDAKNPQVIETIPRRGYRLIAPVTQSAPVTKLQPSIAVLAFADMSPEQDQQYFCDGIAEEIINSLTRVKDLQVASRTSAFVFKGKSEDIRKIGRSLAVGAILEGSVRKSGDRLRITAQLISVADGYHLWSERFDRELKDVFAIQDEIARSIASTLQVTLSQGEREALGKAPTEDLLAYDYYLRGKQFFYQYKCKGVEFALRMFAQAIERGPGCVETRVTRVVLQRSPASVLVLRAHEHPDSRGDRGVRTVVAERAQRIEEFPDHVGVSDVERRLQVVHQILELLW